MLFNTVQIWVHINCCKVVTLLEQKFHCWIALKFIDFNYNFTSKWSKQVDQCAPMLTVHRVIVLSLVVTLLGQKSFRIVLCLKKNLHFWIVLSLVVTSLGQKSWSLNCSVHIYTRARKFIAELQLSWGQKSAELSWNYSAPCPSAKRLSLNCQVVVTLLGKKVFGDCVEKIGLIWCLTFPPCFLLAHKKNACNLVLCAPKFAVDVPYLLHFSSHSFCQAETGNKQVETLKTIMNLWLWCIHRDKWCNFHVLSAGQAFVKVTRLLYKFEININKLKAYIWNEIYKFKWCNLQHVFKLLKILFANMFAIYNVLVRMNRAISLNNIHNITQIYVLHL